MVWREGVGELETSVSLETDQLFNSHVALHIIWNSYFLYVPCTSSFFCTFIYHTYKCDLFAVLKLCLSGGLHSLFL